MSKRCEKMIEKHLDDLDEKCDHYIYVPRSLGLTIRTPITTKTQTDPDPSSNS